MRLSKILLPTIALVGLCLFSGCARVVSLDAADDAANADCAEIIVRLPDTVDGLPRQKTDAQSAGAWGTPSEVLLRCGVAVAGPTTDRCVAINDVDWIIDETRSDYVIATTYGRDPSTEVVVNRSHAGASVVLADLAAAVRILPADRHCT